ncbi:hypothetical protein FOZ63_005308, partial [Perkinsus olseni]
ACLSILLGLLQLGRPLDEQALVPKVVTVLSNGSYVREHHQRGSPEVVEPAKLECTKRAAHRSLDSEGLQEMHIRFESWTDASSMFDRLAEALTAYHDRHAT